MVPTTLAGIFAVAAATYLIAAAGKRFRLAPSPALQSYLFYLIFWHLLLIYMQIYMASPMILPESAQQGYLLFNSIFTIPLHGLIAVFFADFMVKWLHGKAPRLMKTGVSIPFGVILIFYSWRVLQRLSVDESSEPFVLIAPISFALMVFVIVGLLIYGAINSRRLKDRPAGRCVFAFSLVMMGGVLLGVFFIAGPFNDLGIHWGNAITSFVFTAMNVAGWWVCRSAFQPSKSAPSEARSVADLDRLKELYGISPREKEIIALVISGKSNQEIVEQLFISPDTVKKHIYNIYKKIGVKNRVQLSNAVLDLKRIGNSIKG
ncbi:MAG: LuxR C-terminal-related transcriptional regulator [Planctomycetota bacterium]